MSTAAMAARIVLLGLAVNHLAEALFIEQSPTPLKFFDLNLKDEVKFYRATGPMDKCNRVGRTMTGDPYKKACKLNGRRKRDKHGAKASVCLCVETPAFLRLKIQAANNFVDEADQTEVNDDSGYARVCGVCDRRGKFKPEGGRNRWIPQPIRDMGETVNDAIDSLRNLFRRDKRDADEDNEKRGRFIEVLQAVVESVPVPEFPDVEINPEFNFGIVNFNKREADKDDW